MIRLRYLLPIAAIATFLNYATPASAQTIIDEWQSVKTPPAPALSTVTVNPKTTALLMLDFIKQTCNQQHRPRCLASLPKAKKLLAEARAKEMLVVYSIIPGPATISDILPDVAPTDKEPFVKSGVDKFYKTNLEQILKGKNIQTVIVMGTAAHGAVLYTASAAVLRGFKVIIPVDGMSAENAYIEQYVAYNFTHAPVIASKTTLTSVDWVGF